VAVASAAVVAGMFAVDAEVATGTEASLSFGTRDAATAVPLPSLSVLGAAAPTIAMASTATATMIHTRTAATAEIVAGVPAAGGDTSIRRASTSLELDSSYSTSTSTSFELVETQEATALEALVGQVGLSVRGSVPNQEYLLCRTASYIQPLPCDRNVNYVRPSYQQYSYHSCIAYTRCKFFLSSRSFNLFKDLHHHPCFVVCVPLHTGAPCRWARPDLCPPRRSFDRSGYPLSVHWTSPEPRQRGTTPGAVSGHLRGRSKRMPTGKLC